MYVVALTGGIGSGKSTVSGLFEKLGVPVIDADLIAREVTEPTAKAFPIIVEHFGSSIVASDGTLNRRELRKRIFADENERRFLEKLLHPLIQESIAAKLK